MIKDLYVQMLKYNFKPSHKLDQNFIIEDSVILRVVKELELEKTDVILEIGPGTGFLTKRLLEETKEVIAIEKDKKMIDILKQEFAKENKLILINSDFLDINLEDYKHTKIAGFLPYSISQDFIEKILKENKIIVAVVQKEFAEKLNSVSGFINYNAVSVLTQSYFKIQIVKKISKKCFFPVPSCESAIIKLIPKNKKHNTDYNEFVKNLFRYTNKDIKNALGLISIDKEKINKIKAEILKKKVRQIKIEEIEEIYSVINN